MKTDLRNKFLDGVVSALIIMALMWPLILMFRLLPKWGAAGYWGAAVIVLMAGTWMLHRTTLKNRSEVGRVWYGTAGGLCFWTVSEISHEIGLIDIGGVNIVLVLALFVPFLAVLWKFFPTGAKFFITIFMANWVGHVFIHVSEEFLAGFAVKTFFTITAAAFGLLIIGLLYWIFIHTTNRIQRLWAGLWIWFALSMIYFLALY